MQLTDKQLSFFCTFGYLALPGLMSDCINEITDGFHAVFDSQGGGHNNQKHDGESRSCIVPFIDQNKHLSALLDEPRIHVLLCSLLGDDFNYMGSDGNIYVGDTNWHSDGWNEGSLYVKIAFYLDSISRDTGCLRVVPGSHNVDDAYGAALNDFLPQPNTNFGMPGSDIPSIALDVEPGDILIFNHRLKHSSWGGDNQRRMFTINCGEHVIDEFIPGLKHYIAGSARFWLDSMYGEIMKETAGPQRMKHLEQVLANEGHLAALSAQARKDNKEPSRG